ncbi:MAG: demethoxyubiquinone hydroxylase family protein [Gammaproteobacteria bacterium]|nr:demethoxyubiquinone hydroxylase family protein [Gammaproteobacteria bacterium]|tara:strand:+ start:1649 stop:2281 length:633 start_codon:yes stop_codon:yes gene_type:complete
MKPKNETHLDSLLNEIEYALDCIYNHESVCDTSEDVRIELDQKDAKKSESLMRVNHMGEVCAQGLYRGQAAFTKNTKVKEKLYSICKEEKTHLSMCNSRLNELNGKRTIFNPVWYLASFTLGVIAARNEKSWQLGFIEETERQVKIHLDESINMLPEKDYKSKKILKKIAVDEEKHRKTAKDIGSKKLPDSIRNSMDILSKIMKKITYHV